MAKENKLGYYEFNVRKETGEQHTVWFKTVMAGPDNGRIVLTNDWGALYDYAQEEIRTMDKGVRQKVLFIKEAAQKWFKGECGGVKGIDYEYYD
jgi:hypothetical protein